LDRDTPGVWTSTLYVLNLDDPLGYRTNAESVQRDRRRYGAALLRGTPRDGWRPCDGLEG
jgi:hypothetical protein